MVKIGGYIMVKNGSFEGYCIISTDKDFCWDFLCNAWVPYPERFEQNCIGMKWQTENKQKELGGDRGEIKKVSIIYTIS